MVPAIPYSSAAYIFESDYEPPPPTRESESTYERVSGRRYIILGAPQHFDGLGNKQITEEMILKQ